MATLAIFRLPSVAPSRLNPESPVTTDIPRTLALQTLLRTMVGLPIIGMVVPTRMVSVPEVLLLFRLAPLPGITVVVPVLETEKLVQVEARLRLRTLRLLTLILVGMCRLTAPLTTPKTTNTMIIMHILMATRFSSRAFSRVKLLLQNRFPFMLLLLPENRFIVTAFYMLPVKRMEIVFMGLLTPVTPLKNLMSRIMRTLVIKLTTKVLKGEIVL